MAETRIVVVGASAGGIQALRTLVSGLPADFPAPICIVLHTSPESPGTLPDILARVGPLPASSPRDGEPLVPGSIYVAPPDRHLMVEPGRVRVTRGPRENRFRPAIDPLFRSAAQVYGPATVGVILTGSLDDGTAGLWAIKGRGGIAVVQDPADALFPSMPRSALANVEVDHCVPIGGIAPLLTMLTAAAAPAEGVAAPGGGPSDPVDVEVQIAKEEDPLEAGLPAISEPSLYACPECHGVLMRLKEAGPPRFRCHTGHAYSLQSLLAHISHGIEEALWNAVRALDEGAMLIGQIEAHLPGVTTLPEGGDLGHRAREARRGSEMIRKLIAHREAARAGNS